MNASDIGKAKCTLHQSEAQRLLSWLKCYPVVGRENERKSLEIILEMALSLAGQRACAYRSGNIVCGEPESAHSLEAAQCDIGMDHQFIPATWDYVSSKDE
jgi:hypothetical protein